ncbi:MAG: hypothetical protein UT31_C0005G0008 [Parcubacteria group bacterium GW2011_GWF2_39_13b]|nr:MAG: hypothetical protein UT31_C0005G0008 [Parcubacteria group bacterium GW2011_GWF2_39_13b]
MAHEEVFVSVPCPHCNQQTPLKAERQLCKTEQGLIHEVIFRRQNATCVHCGLLFELRNGRGNFLLLPEKESA